MQRDLNHSDLSLPKQRLILLQRSLTFLLKPILYCESPFKIKTHWANLWGSAPRPHQRGHAYCHLHTAKELCQTFCRIFAKMSRYSMDPVACTYATCNQASLSNSHSPQSHQLSHLDIWLWSLARWHIHRYLTRMCLFHLKSCLCIHLNRQDSSLARRSCTHGLCGQCIGQHHRILLVLSFRNKHWHFCLSSLQATVQTVSVWMPSVRFWSPVQSSRGTNRARCQLSLVCTQTDWKWANAHHCV